MGRVLGEIIKDDGVVGHILLMTIELCAISSIWHTSEEARKNWQVDTSGIWKECKCDQPPDEVFIYADYGNGCYWPAKVCLNCHAIVDGCRPEIEQPERLQDLHSVVWWPKNGHPLRN